jgi:4-amino-4-deoxy-L-arabinose transferase-like glycosyltransferase
MLVTVKDKRSTTEILLVAAATIACLAPFAGKAFNIDDPLFIWVARQIHYHPIDFYGFTINWYGRAMPAAEVIKNPPLASYYIALVANLIGWSETALHLAFLLPATAAAIATYLLAREFSRQSLAAALIAIATPIFLVSSTTVMCDVLMLSLYVWAVLLWVRGLKSDNGLLIVCASALIALCSLTKYFGISLIPLLLIYSLTARQGKRHRALLLAIPVVILALYQYATIRLYGRGLLLDAASYATETRKATSLLTTLLVGLSFTGGCLLSALFYAPLLWGKRAMAAAALFVAGGAFLLPFVKVPHAPEKLTWGFTLQLSLLIAAGAHILALALLDLRKRRDADSLLLFLWVTGTFIFATFVNWSTNGRSILPMAPAIGILVARHLEYRHGERYGGLTCATFPLAPALLVALAVTWSDYRLADTARSAAGELSRIRGRNPSPSWFQGHWGFQYYMEKAGGKALDIKHPSISPGDLMIIPGYNTNIDPEYMKSCRVLGALKLTASSILTTNNGAAGAGLYSNSFGPVPFVIGNVPDEAYYVLEVPGPVQKN